MPPAPAPTPPVSITLDPALPVRELAGAFARFGRVHAPGFLADGSARALHEALVVDPLWMCSTTSKGTQVDIPVEMLEAMPPDQTRQLMHLAHAEAMRGFHYMFDNIRISELADRGEPLSPMLAAAYAFVNSRPFLDFVAAVTGDNRGVYADAQATRYLPGHYLTRHDDRKPRAGRLCAYVLNLTPEWRADWGGLLNFIDADGHVAEAYTPTFNALNLLRVPQDHAVSCVAPFAGGARLSITGWVRDARPAANA
ncbi:2OG-Fe(II) oxygenase [Rhizobium sp. CRIBSB]|nr:2OG-Fe(II) oxygenase [Rhizobium sp. CRIBSB]